MPRLLRTTGCCVVDRELDELTASLPAVCLEGPRGAGKTTTALQRATEVFELDNPDTLSVVAADPERIVQAGGTVVVDEWQRMPYTWDLVRRAVDENPQPGRFILTGSASPATPPTHSGAGRIVSVRMRPLSLCERRDAPPSQVAGGLRGRNGHHDIVRENPRRRHERPR